jgi:hypothetical protein
MNRSDLKPGINIVTDVTDRFQKFYVLDLTQQPHDPNKIRIWDTQERIFISEDRVFLNRMKFAKISEETSSTIQSLYELQPNKVYHTSRPKTGMESPPHLSSSIKSTPTTTVTPEAKKMLDDLKKAPGKEVCSNCGGDGGAKGECYKCDGTGWTNN